MTKTGRQRLKDDAPADAKELYFARQDTHEFVTTGSTLLDCVLGGGVPLGRVINVVGDKSTGKTLICIELATNFLYKYPKGRVWYNESEAAFDAEYATALGMPLDRVDFPDSCVTVEDVFEDLIKALEQATKDGTPGIYIIDSLDALSDRAELDRGISDGTYGATKARKLSEMFRRIIQPLRKAQVALVIISQVRSKLTITYGRTTTRSGGRALDFYASQVLYLAQSKRYEKTIKGVKRPTGIQIKVKCDKNKVGLPFRDCILDVMFGFGIDDMSSCAGWLDTVKALDRATDLGYQPFIRATRSMSDDEYFKTLAKIREVTRAAWKEIDVSFLPTRRKYGNTT